MPRYIGHYIGISFQAELLIMTLLGLLNSILEWHPFDWSQQIEKIWNLSLTQQYLLFYTDFEYWIKTILTWIVIIRKIVAYVYTFFYMINFYPILTWSRPNLLLLWLVLSFFQNLILKFIVIMIFVWLWARERFSSFRMIEFIFVEILSLTNSAYVWYAIACSYKELTKMEKIRKMRKALEAKYSVAHDLFYLNDTSVEISKESSFGSSLGRHHMSLPNLNDAFYRSIFNDNSDNKVSRSLTTLMTISSFELDDTEIVYEIIRNDNLMPDEKCMKLLGLTDVDVINARTRVRKRILENNTINKIQEEYKQNNVIGQIDPFYAIRGPFIIDHLMMQTAGQCYALSKSQTNDKQVDETFKEVKDEEILKEIEPNKIDDVNENDKLIIELEVKPMEFTQPKESERAIAPDRIDRLKKETNCEFVKKKKKKKICPLMEDKIRSRPCFPFVGNRQFKECPFKEQAILSNFIFSSFLNKIDIRNDDNVTGENIIFLDNVNVKKITKNDTTIDEFVINTNDIYKETLYKSSSSSKDRGKVMTCNNTNTELLFFKIPERMTYHIDLEYESVFNPRVKKDSKLRLNLQNLELITKYRYASIKSKEERKNNDSIDESFSISRIDLNNDTDKNYEKKNIQRIENLNNNKYDNKVYNKDNDYTTNVYSKYSGNNIINQLSNIDNPIDNDESYKDNAGNGPCYCQNWNTSTMADTSSSEFKKSNVSDKLFLYSNKMKKKSYNRLFNIKSQIVEVSLNENKNVEYFDRSKRSVKLLKNGRKLMITPRERELLEMKALRAYNEITLMEDKREMEEKKKKQRRRPRRRRRRLGQIESIYSFVNNKKSLTTRTASFKSKSKCKQQIRRKIETDLNEFHNNQDHCDSYNETEIRNITDSFFEHVNNDELLIEEKENRNFLENESSFSRLPFIPDKDAAIMLNLLNRHGSHWFKQQLERILTIRDSRACVKSKKPNRVPTKLDLSLRNCQKIDDSLEFNDNTDKMDLNVPFGISLSGKYLQSNLDLNSSENSRRSIVNDKNTITNSSDCRENCIEPKENLETYERKTIDIPKKSEISKIDKSEIKFEKVEKNDVSRSTIRNSTSISSSPPRIEEEDYSIESIDDFDDRQVGRINASLRLMDIARNVQWNLRPRGIILSNKNVRETNNNRYSYRFSVDDQRDIVDEITASMVHAALTYKPEIIVGSFPTDSRSIEDERSVSLIDYFYDINRSPSLDDGSSSILHANNEMDIYIENPSILPNYCPSADGFVNFCIFSTEDEDFFSLPFDSRSVSIYDIPSNEIVRPEFDEITDTEINSPSSSSSNDTIENFDRSSFDTIIAFFSFILTLYLEIWRSYLFSNYSNSYNTLYAYRPYEVRSDNLTFKTNLFDELLISNKSESVVESKNLEYSESTVRFNEQKGIGIIDYNIEEIDEDAIENTNSRISNINDSFDTMYTKSTVNSENAISFGKGSSMEEFS